MLLLRFIDSSLLTSPLADEGDLGVPPDAERAASEAPLPCLPLLEVPCSICARMSWVLRRKTCHCHMGRTYWCKVSLRNKASVMELRNGALPR